MKELEIYKLLPGKNCRECSPGTCMAFAIKVNREPSLLDECPYMEHEKRNYLRAHLIKSDWRDNLIESLKKEVSRINFNDIAAHLGAGLTEDGLFIRCIGRDYLIKRDGSVIPEVENKWIKILLLHYIRTGGRGNFTGRWISFSEMRGGLLKASTFQRDCESPLREIFDINPCRILKVFESLGGKNLEGYPADLAITLDLLPKIRTLILYSRADEEFLSSLKILFDAITPEFLDVESIIFLLEGLVHTVKYMTLT
ncbi:MAG: DUF3786 domain-containing protein [Thermodesulfovibrionales bacterium]|nr:DUF3786 domain-containing protein [Thermodesulfovibrionales bacterium]